MLLLQWMRYVTFGLIDFYRKDNSAKVKYCEGGSINGSNKGHSMKAIRFHEYGSFEMRSSEDVPLPLQFPAIAGVDVAGSSQQRVRE